jgi:hypothetical protein
VAIGPVRPEAKNDLADKEQNLIRAASEMIQSLIVMKQKYGYGPDWAWNQE